MARSQEDIIRNIQNLINLQESYEATGDKGAAESAALKVQAWLLKYNLDLETVNANQVQKKVEMDEVQMDTSNMFDKRESTWVPKLYVTIAENHLCWVRTYGNMVKILGHKMNVALVAYIVEQLIAKIRLCEKIAWKQYEKEGGYEKRGTYRRGFFEGAVFGINSKLKSQKDDWCKADNSMALMVINKEQEVLDYVYQRFPWLRPATQQEIQAASDKHAAEWNALTPQEREKRKKKEEREEKAWEKKMAKRKGPRGLSSNEGWNQGYETGKKLEINKGVGDQKTKGNLS